jgi:hypothetical protein
VRHYVQIPTSPYESYTRGVDIFRVCLGNGGFKWMEEN